MSVRPISHEDFFFHRKSGRDGNRAPTLAPCSFRMVAIGQPVDELAGIIVGSRRAEDVLQGGRSAHPGSRHDSILSKGSGICGGGTRRVGSHQEMELVRLVGKRDRLACFDGEGLWGKGIDILRPCFSVIVTAAVILDAVGWEELGCVVKEGLDPPLQAASANERTTTSDTTIQSHFEWSRGRE
jgi:hypothetical protein